MPDSNSPSASALDALSKKEIKELLSKGWITHDAMWYGVCRREFGADKANEMNLAAVALMASFEVARIRRAIGMRDVEIDTFDKLRSFFEQTMDLILPEFMHGEYSFPAPKVIEWEWQQDQCFAYKGLKRVGFIDGYRCGVMYRIQCWLRTLNIRFRFDPPVDGCLMHERGACKGIILLDFPAPEDSSARGAGGRA